MPLLDHFRPPLSTRRHWHSFHNAWSSTIKTELNRILPEGYFAEANVQFGIEIDVAVQEQIPAVRSNGTGSWMPKAPTLTVPFQPTTDTIEVLVFSTREGPILVGAIELVSPANKDRSASKDAFVAKCETYLNQGIGLVIVDVVTTLNANLHGELMQRIGMKTTLSSLYATAYRAVDQDGNSVLEIWQEELCVDADLPTLPLWLKDGICLPIELEKTYEQTRIESRL
ncbi:DUF4058 family protein [Leptolyngbya sp. DQ-M1]|uniref:DUF4058 family protein n=1 Tax=Leptolyngbya sp. DQ-M1 TaxID=2933920 RepID=UPI00329A0736